jgi:N-acetylmuramoyl-L-alanine amidase
MIFLLAGHGGGDVGAVGVRGRTESAETITLRDKIKSYIPSTTRLFVDNDRDNLRNVLSKATTGSGSVTLDIHFNAAANPKAGGVEVLVGDDAGPEDLTLAHDVLDVLTKHTGLRNRGVKKESDTPRKRLGVMREFGAVCLLETCFISNPEDMAAFDKASDAIARDLAAVLIKHDAKVQ